MSHNPANPVPMRGRSELIVIAKAEAGLRAVAGGVSSVANVDTSSLAAVLAAHGAQIHPLFGLSEDRLRAQAAALASAAGQPTEPLPDLALFYRIEADE